MSGPDITRSVVLKLRSGDADAGEALDQAYRAPLRRFVQHYLRNAHDVEDAVQEVFARALSSTAVPDRFRAWLYRVARNVCFNRLRASRVRGHDRLPTDFESPADETGHLTGLVRAEGNEALFRSLARLSENQREALYLRYVEDLSRDDVAEVLDVPVSVVKSRLYEGVARLRRIAAER